MGTTPRPIDDRLHIMASEQQERLARHRAEALKLPYISLLVYPLNPDDLELVPKETAQAAKALLFYKQGKDIRLAVINPGLPGVAELVAQLKSQFGVSPQLHIMSDRSFQVGLTRYRPIRVNDTKPQDEMRVSTEEFKKDQQRATLTDLAQQLQNQSPTQLLSMIMSGAVALGASDIHLEAKEKETRLRYRIDGVLQDVAVLPTDVYHLILSRIKVMSKLKLNVHEVPQDGSFVLRVGEAIYDIRVSTLPGGFGENGVMRLLNRASEAVTITDLGMKETDYAVVMRELARSNGMILATGPTGSGKTTSLAAFINSINSSDLKIITLEDPIEYRLAGVEQTQIEEEQGYSFAKGLRAILRQDPDVILVGEMRDLETAETAVHASLTGHLVFSTLHTNNAPGAVVRLIDMGIKPFVIAPALNLVIAQRLIRVVCAACGEEKPLSEEQRQKIRQTMVGVRSDIFDPKRLDDKKLTVLKGKGCSVCHNTGYKGRKGLFEVMAVEGPVEELVLAAADGNTIQKAAQKAGMTTILQDGYLKVLDKITTIEEVDRVTEE